VGNLCISLCGPHLLNDTCQEALFGPLRVNLQDKTSYENEFHHGSDDLFKSVSLKGVFFLPVLWVQDVYPRSRIQFFPSRIQQHKKLTENLSILNYFNPRNISKLSENMGCIRDLGGQNSIGSPIRISHSVSRWKVRDMEQAETRSNV
jgi:hypothetical protein